MSGRVPGGSSGATAAGGTSHCSRVTCRHHWASTGTRTGGGAVGGTPAPRPDWSLRVVEPAQAHARAHYKRAIRPDRVAALGVTQLASPRQAGDRGIGDQAVVPQNVHHLRDPAALRVLRMDVEALGHARQLTITGF